MRVLKVDDDRYKIDYMSVVQILTKLADPTFMWVEAGRGSGKTTKVQGPRLDRVQNSMPGSIIILGSATYKSIFDNILPGMMEYFYDNYERGMYFEIGKQPPEHFGCPMFITDWKHTISFCTGTVVQFASCDRPESFLGKNAAHLIIDELLKIPEDKFVSNVVPALRADRSKFGSSPYFMGITGTSSTPDFETDEDWWMNYEQNQIKEVIQDIIEVALNLDKKIYKLEEAKVACNEQEIKKLDKYITRWTARLNEARRGQTMYLKASSLSNIKILGVDYIENQVKTIKDEGKLNSSIFAVRKYKVGELFFGRFGKEHIFDDSYTYNIIDTISADMTPENTSRDLKYCNTNQALIAGFDPGPFMSITFAQNRVSLGDKEFRILKDFHVIHPHQHVELAELIDDYFKYHKRKEIYLHYDRAANQNDPHYRKYYPLSGDDKDADALLLKKALEAKKWRVHLLSIGQGVIRHSTHYMLLNILFGKHGKNIPKMLIDRNECETLISSINHSPLKRDEGEIKLDKSAEKNLPYDQQALYSPQIATSLMYMLYGEFRKFLPQNGQTMPNISSTYMG